ncbi:MULTISPECIES: GNAT family N-acetyltransferase [Peribacillus]|uniref:GNAT family N-acetyltransferase n=1 Tax=Peribacillus TaxID=2675229 RepID=UPI001F4DEF76|nr:MULTISPECIES: GNAT family N-acetyltransferase [unclassified Peribacillus]MCK1985729.1 GNAT family N-acetyltransferase [Peribacillus sp. Aquil_B1]MCK2011372.1 GNAT family N-acetyltransferase [Peribacillus sp. Aquil_B8]
MTEMIPLTSENLEQCIELYMNVFNREPWNENWTYETAKERLSDLLHTPKFLGFLFQVDHHAVGFVAGNSKVSYQGLTYYLAELCVNNEMQGKGHGSKMLQSLEDELQKREIESLYLLTANDGLAEAFYLKNDYVVNEDRVVMKKNLF